MKTTIVLAVLLAAATPAFAQYGSSYGYGQGSPGATMQDYRLAPHQRTTNCRTMITHRMGPNGNNITVRRRICD
jgi:hypothetical protein